MTDATIQITSRNEEVQTSNASSHEISIAALSYSQHFVTLIEISLSVAVNCRRSALDKLTLYTYAVNLPYNTTQCKQSLCNTKRNIAACGYVHVICNVLFSSNPPTHEFEYNRSEKTISCKSVFTSHKNQYSRGEDKTDITKTTDRLFFMKISMWPKRWKRNKLGN